MSDSLSLPLSGELESENMSSVRVCRFSFPDKLPSHAVVALKLYRFK